MQRTTRTFSIETVSNLNEKLLRWAQQYETVVWLDSNKHNQEHSNFDAILAIEEFTSIQTDAEKVNPTISSAMFILENDYWKLLMMEIHAMLP